MRHFEEVTYYKEIDEEDGELFGEGDYLHIILYNKDTEEVAVQFGDYYHDKGQDKLEGFYQGLKYAGVEFDVTYRVDKA